MTLDASALLNPVIPFYQNFLKIIFHFYLHAQRKERQGDMFHVLIHCPYSENAMAEPG